MYRLIPRLILGKVIFIFLFFYFFIFFSSVAYATTIFSPLLDIEVDPGDSQNGIVKLFNETDSDLFLVSSLEPFTAGDEDGQPIYLPSEEKHDYLNWFKIEQDSVVLLPHQVIVIPFTVTVPADAVPGGYYAVIFWETRPGPAGEETGVSIRSKVGTLIFLKVKGEVAEEGEIIEFKTKSNRNYFWQMPLNFVTRFSNSGNVHLRPVGTIELKSLLGQTETLKINPQERFVLPGSVRRFEVVWGKMLTGNFWQNFWIELKQELSYLTFGRYTATLNLTFGLDHEQKLTRQLSFWFIPVRLIIFLVIIIVIIFLLVKINSRIKKLKNKSPSNSVPSTPFETGGTSPSASVGTSQKNKDVKRQ